MTNAKRLTFCGALCSSYLIALTASLAVLYSPAGNAGFYKCIDTDGNVTYSQTECPINETTDKVISAGGGSSSNNDCRIARHFMSKTAKQMRRGQSSGEVFDQYGGMDSIPRSSVALINYVYTFQYNHTVTAERITGLSTARCRSGSFGPTGCEDFPHAYIDSMGGCEAAALGGPQYAQPGGRNYTAEEEGANNGYNPANAVQQTTNGLNYSNQSGLRAAQALQIKKLRCTQETKAQMRSVSERMRARSTAASQDSLRAQNRALQKQLSNC